MNSKIRHGLIGTIGQTPLIRLNRLSKETGCNILAKAEFLNPGGSVKDRAALQMIQQAQESGALQPQGTVVEGTAGNTGIGLAHVCNALDLKCVIYMPNTQSQEKIDLLRILGADVRPVPAVPFTDEMNYNHQAKRHAAGLTNAIWTNQFDNTANKLAHFKTTGPEIFTQTDGQLDAFVCATGTGGTLAGVSDYLKQQNPAIKVFLADPPGSVLYRFVNEGKLEREGSGSITEGIGQGRVTDNLKGTAIDGAVHISDEKSIEMVYRLLAEEGLFVGASSALNIVAAQDIARQLGPGHTIVTILCDSASRYQTRLFSRAWLLEKNLDTAVPDSLQHFINA